MPLITLPIAFGVLLIALTAIGWKTVLPWVLRLFTPAPAVQLPRLVLAPDADEPERTDLPGQVARL
ncbi:MULTISPECIES: hypothetical protein [Streptomyces]|uniref:Uncharacterized protein n=2 Tax=Streptomyces TaxID=1883 RepID=A0A3M8VY50_9ACTN|nr:MULTISPECIES: hypothetical protein [Streptomyces]MBP2068757.1 hypothetical protein [Streptomyces iranensis]RNG22828.1 hypothetical protein EEJ42_19530 [Streptomyces botrytidirepellens]CDR18110.1 predicted protein [Streptomyces iranensis]